MDVAGDPTSEPAVLALIETRIGEPLAMPRVRSTIDHLVGLGRFEDIRVFATPADQGVVLQWSLTPIRLVAAISVSGAAAVSEATIRGEVLDRFGPAPSAARVGEVVRALQTYYEDRGYRGASITPTLVDGDTPGRVELHLAITAGARSTIGVTTISGTPLEPAADLLKKLALEPGRPFDRPALAARLTRYEDELRTLGYYEAHVRETHVFSEDGRTATLALDVQPGPHVKVVFAGDPLPESERQALVPIREERSVDLDLLEDASRNIEAALRKQGYRAARAPYMREQVGGELLLTFTVTRGPLAPGGRR